MARRPIRNGLAGALGNRQGLDEDEQQERRQAGRCRRRRGGALPLGLNPYRFKERAQRRRLLPRRGTADAGRLPDSDVDPRGDRAGRSDRNLDDDAWRARDGQRQSQVPPHVQPEPRRQRAGSGKNLPLRLARRLVCRWSSGLPSDRAWLELLGGRRLPRNLGDWLWRRTGLSAEVRPPARRRGPWRARRQNGSADRLRAGLLPGGYRDCAELRR